MAERFQDLRVWQAAMDLAVDLAALVDKFPREMRWLAQQLMRSSESTPSNIAEGFERLLDGDFARFLRMAKASMGETESHLVYACRRRLITDDEYSKVAGECMDVKRMLSRLITHLISKNHP